MGATVMACPTILSLSSHFSATCDPELITVFITWQLKTIKCMHHVFNLIINRDNKYEICKFQPENMLFSPFSDDHIIHDDGVCDLALVTYDTFPADDGFFHGHLLSDSHAFGHHAVWTNL